MEPVQIPWPLSSAPGERPQESAGRLYNCFAEPIQKESGPAAVTYKRTTGLTAFATSGQTGFRGSLLVQASVFAAFLNRLVTIDSAGAVTDVGALAGSLPVSFARNQLNPTPQVGVVTDSGAFLVTGASIAAWPDPDLPQPNSISFQDGYFFFTIGDNRVFATDPNSTAVNSQTFTTMQSRAGSSMLRGIPYNGLMYFFGTTSIEVYQNGGGAVEAPKFPYIRLQVIDRGLASGSAIAGWEPGFTNPIWVGDDDGVWRLGSNGLVPEKISPPDLDRMIKAISDKTTLRAGCYVNAGRKFWTLSSPIWTWEFNLNTEKWHERRSTHAGLISTLWRGQGGILAFNKWLLGSSTTGNIVSIDNTNYFEEGENIQWMMESGPVSNFPKSMRVGRADFNFVTGVGIPGGDASQQNPRVAISWSDDGGNRWGTPVLRSLGVGQHSLTRVTINNPGRTQAQGRRWRLEVLDGVYVGFLGATMSVNVRGP